MVAVTNVAVLSPCVHLNDSSLLLSATYRKICEACVPSQFDFWYTYTVCRSLNRPALLYLLTWPGAAKEKMNVITSKIIRIWIAFGVRLQHWQAGYNTQQRPLSSSGISTRAKRQLKQILIPGFIVSGISTT